MNKKELIDQIADKANITKTSAVEILNAFLEVVKSSLKKNDPVVLPDFGTFTVKTRAPREGRNPSTGEKIYINAAKVVGFKAGKGLKEAVKDEVNT